jgi:hypothetical protein
MRLSNIDKNLTYQIKMWGLCMLVRLLGIVIAGLVILGCELPQVVQPEPMVPMALVDGVDSLVVDSVVIVDSFPLVQLTGEVQLEKLLDKVWNYSTGDTATAIHIASDSLVIDRVHKSFNHTDTIYMESNEQASIGVKEFLKSNNLSPRNDNELYWFNYKSSDYKAYNEYAYCGYELLGDTLVLRIRALSWFANIPNNLGVENTNDCSYHCSGMEMDSSEIRVTMSLVSGLYLLGHTDTVVYRTPISREEYRQIVSGM